MNNRCRIALATLVAALASASGWFVLHTREPAYEGKPLRWWLEQMDARLLGSGSEPQLSRFELEESRQRVTTALRAMDTNALPHLVRLLVTEDKPTAFSKAMDWINKRQNLLNTRLPGSPPWPAYAREAFRLLGSNATPAIPELAKLLQVERTAPDAMEALLSIGPAALPVFIQALTNQSDRVRGAALLMLGDLGPAAGEAIPLIAEIARDTNASYSGTAIRVLSHLDTNSARHLPLLESRLFDTNHATDAAFALARMGSNGMPLLLQAMTNQNRAIRTGALAALQLAVSRPETDRETALTDFPFRHMVCLFNLKFLSAAFAMYQGSDTLLAVPALTRTVIHADPAVQATAAEQLARHGLAGAVGLSLAAENGSAIVREAARAALTELGFEIHGGAVTRGPKSEKRLALVFTGHSYGEGGEAILDALAKRNAKGSFFLTGEFLTNQHFAPIIKRIVREDHYLGPHSDRHVLYCAWEPAKPTLVTGDEFRADLAANLEKIKQAILIDSSRRTLKPQVDRSGQLPSTARRTMVRCFLPPYEHYNRDVALWTLDMGLILVNFTPGTRSTADYTGETDENFVSSRAILDSILTRERQDPHGLNGFILLLHVGAGPGRNDKFHNRLDQLLDVIAARGYQFVRVDELLGPKETK